jgi:DNA-directed RNA polymerase subunit RPC12/RpoP
MKLPKSNIVIETGGAGIEAEFGIENIGFILKLLRDKMYTNPIKAICREISCNARDAHREVGKRSVPIEIHLPCVMDSTFRVKDYGPGISPERMQNVFILYGNSTKNQDNVQTGGFGLGAKTPFAYSDQFSVITTTPELWGEYECSDCNHTWMQKDSVIECPNCRSNNIGHTPKKVHVKRNYIAYIDETERGKMREVSTELTDESCGTEIVLEVKKQDWEKFAADTVSVTKYWTVNGEPRPKLTGKSPAPVYSTNDDETLLEGVGWRLPKNGGSDNYYYGRSSKAIVDGISYEVDNDLFDSDDVTLLRKGLLFEFGVGVLTLTPQRESLQYDENTITEIKSRLESVRESVAKVIADRIATAKNYREAVEIYREISQIFRGIMPKDYKPTWNGTPCHSQRVTLNILANTTSHSKTYLKKAVSDEKKYTLGVRLTVYENRDNKNGDTLVYSDVTKHLDISSQSQVFVNDLGSTRIPRARIRHYIEQNDNVKYVQLLTFDEGIDTEKGLDLCKSANPDKIDLRLLGIHKLSSMPVPPKEEKERTTVSGSTGPAGRGRGKRRTTFDVYQWDPAYDARRELDKCWRPVEIEKYSGNGVYVILEDYKRQISSGKMNLGRDRIRKIKDSFGFDLFGVRAKDVEQLGPDMVPLEIAVKRALDKKIAECGYNLGEIREAQYVISHVSMRDVFGHYIWNDALSGNMSRVEDKDSSLLYECYQEYNKYAKINEKGKSILWIADEVYPTDKEVEADTKTLKDYKEKVRERYPLLKRIDGWRFSDQDVAALFEYINMIDKKYAEEEQDFAEAPLVASA